MLHAASNPGFILELPPAEAAAPAYLAVVATLADRAATVADPDQLLDESDWRFLGARQGEPVAADFVVADGSRPPAADFYVRLGGIERPDLGATLVLAGEADSFASERCGSSISLAGPGVAQPRIISTPGFHSQWFLWRNVNVRRFPLGVDVILAVRQEIVFIPRTTVLTIQEEPAWAT